jgi:microcin C transport system ATP-binding protein
VKSLLRVENLRVVFSSRGSALTALDGVSLEVEAGELVGLMGASGSGKTTLALAVLSLLPESGHASGSICYRGRELLALEEDQLQKIRGSEISIIFQDPALTLHPTLPVGEQVADIIRAHEGCDRKRSREEARFALAQVRLNDVRRIYAAYPHQLSGGERRRVAIAQALASKPALLIADELTESLDRSTQADILRLVAEIKEDLGIAMLLISHDPAVAAEMAARTIVMSCGRIVEQGTLKDIFEEPRHTYTRALKHHVLQRLDECIRAQPKPGC